MRIEAVAQLFFCCLLALPVTQIASAQPKTSVGCIVTITGPKMTDTVAASVVAEGTAKLPQDAYLWILAHVNGLGVWWPQGGGPATVRDARWNVSVVLGTSADSGRDFEIIAIVVDRQTHALLMRWVKDAESRGVYNGILLPSFIPTCSPARVVVLRK